MKVHTNFYETIQEAQMRLDQTVVMYDGQPFFILCVTDHKGDGVFRAYLDPLTDEGEMYHRREHIPYNWHDEPGMNRGQVMDQWLEQTPEGKSSPVLRKMLNSPKFNKFRPFSLGMCNFGTKAFYSERSPTRHTQQGLTGSAITYKDVSLVGNESSSCHSKPSIFSGGIYRTIIGKYPDVDETLTNLTDKEVLNSAAAFNREFAFVRGPLGIMFLAYKSDIVGYLPNSNLQEVKVASEYNYVKEVVDSLGCFNKIS